MRLNKLGVKKMSQEEINQHNESIEAAAEAIELASLGVCDRLEFNKKNEYPVSECFSRNPGCAAILADWIRTYKL